MKKFIKKSNLEILTVIMALLFIFTLITWENAPFTHKILCFYMVLCTLHEWEETRFPGGFYVIMAKKFKLELDKFDLELSHLIVVVLLLFYILVPYFFPSAMFFLFMPVTLGFFEGFVHVMGIFLHKMKKPYTPGMCTAMLMFIVSAYVIYFFVSNNLAFGKDLVIGFILMFIGFIIMQRAIISAAGMNYRDIAQKMKNLKH